MRRQERGMRTWPIGEDDLTSFIDGRRKKVTSMVDRDDRSDAPVIHAPDTARRVGDI